MTDDEKGYINYFEFLGLQDDCKLGEVRKEYRQRMKDLVAEIARVEITEERRSRYLLEMGQLNAAFFILRKAELREDYWAERARVIGLERKWRETVARGEAGADDLRRDFERRMRDFLARYVEEAMLDAGRDRECVEHSHWDAAHERHAFRILRRYRQSLYREILNRLPYVDVTPPAIDWEERARLVASVMAGEPV